MRGSPCKRRNQRAAQGQIQFRKVCGTGQIIDAPEILKPGLSVSERLLQIKALREVGPALGPTSRSDLKERPVAPRFAPGDEEARGTGD